MTSASAVTTVRELVSGLSTEFPLEWAEEWDRVGLVAGDPGAPIRSVLVTLDADRAAVRRAIEGGHDVLLTHHPAVLDVSLPLLADGKTAVLVDALAAGVSLISFHTNLDRSPSGAQAFPDLLGFHTLKPLEAAQQPVAVVSTFAPPEAANGLISALEDAGAGRVGLYSGCAFTVDGSGHFTGLEGSDPVSGEIGENTAGEVRIETTCPQALVGAVVSAIRAAHPYEEPVITTVSAGLSRGAARLGRLCDLGATETLGTLASRCASALGVQARVWGQADRAVQLVAVGNGSAGSLIGAAVALNADVLLAGEVRYHDARAALEAGLAVIEVGHDASEWPLVSVLAKAAQRVLGADITVHEEQPTIDWWTTERR